MLRVKFLICFWLLTLPVFSQSGSKYQVGTIISVKPHQVVADTASGVISYDVSLRVGDITYVVLYTPPMAINPAKYAAGRDLLVLVGEKTIRYNDISGQSFEVPIISRKSTTDTRHSK